MLCFQWARRCEASASEISVGPLDRLEGLQPRSKRTRGVTSTEGDTYQSKVYLRRILSRQERMSQESMWDLVKSVTRGIGSFIAKSRECEQDTRAA